MKQFPRVVDSEFGHVIKKHGPRGQAEFVETVAGLKPGKKGVSWFRPEKDMQRVIKSAPEYLPSVLKQPGKATKFENFMSHPAPGKSFGFRMPLANNAGRGAKRLSDGSILKTRNFKEAYVEYAWVDKKGGGFEMKLKTAYPAKVRSGQ